MVTHQYDHFSNHYHMNHYTEEWEDGTNEIVEFRLRDWREGGETIVEVETSPTMSIKWERSPDNNIVVIQITTFVKK